jgi:diphthamide biosynthesis enzyme Dph1/Dph2-like protein
MKYDLELDKAVQEIKETKAKLVLIQLADGLKPEAKNIVDRLEKETEARFLIWAGSAFGACDFPIETQHLGVDLIIQFGHAPWKYTKDMEPVLK